VADELGTAVLRIEIDDGQARDQLRALRKEIEQAGRLGGRGTRSRGRGADPEEGGIDRQTVRRFNLRGFNAVLRSAAQDIESIRTARRVNLGSSWTKALATISETKTDIDSVASAKKLNINSSWTKFLAQLEETKADIDRAAGTGRRAGIRDGRPQGRPETRPRPGRTSRLSGAISSGIIGGGFPLLFGQGVGAAVGGGLGGVGGGALGGGFGFALSIVGTAVGAAFDEALNKGKTLATGLQDPINQLGALTDASLISSKGVEQQAQGLIAVGREAEAAALVQRDLAQSFGDIAGLTTLTESYDSLARTLGVLSVKTAQFVEGPLTAFLDRLRASLTISPEKQREIEDTASRVVEQQSGPLARTGFFGPIELQFQGETFKGSATGVRQDLITFLSRQALEAEKAVGPLGVDDPVREQERTETLRTQKDLIEAQAAGYQKQALALQLLLSEQKEARDLDNLRARRATEPQLAERRETGDLERLGIEKQLESIKRDELATQSQIGAESQLALRSVQERIAAAKQLAGVEQGIVRSTLEQVLNIQASVAEAKRREQEIGVRIDTARLRGGDAARGEVAGLVVQQQVAAKETELAIINGARELRDAGKQLLEDAKSTARSLQGLREDNLQFQTPQEQARTIAELRRQVQAEATRRGVNVSFQGTPEEQRRQMRGFVSFGEEERRLVQQGEQISLALRTATQPLLGSNTTLGGNLTELSGAVSSLVQKDWNIVVNVQGGSGFDVEGASRGLS
jgi:hypothetical protein